MYFFDNCPGQNKNNHVLRFVPYLVEMGAFQTVTFTFLIAVHTKNICDRMFNAMKATHRKSQAFSMDELCKMIEINQV